MRPKPSALAIIFLISTTVCDWRQRAAAPTAGWRSENIELRHEEEAEFTGSLRPQSLDCRRLTMER